MNRLQKEKSPYLLQHASNPVDWYPWSDEAFAKARKENKPIFLSIGYSTCHWCHVMERESFENEKTADVMNRYFVNIKVDREERPDVDRVYMTAVQTMTGQGGWPLSVFLTPEFKPFYGGTYFPPSGSHGRPGFTTLLERINEVWQREQENVLHSADQLTKELQHRHYVESNDTEIDETILKRTYHQLAAGYDSKFAGFGAGPKFPRPVVLNFLLRYHRRTNEPEALRMSLTTLLAMANGGLYDHLGGGFHRYSVDAQWRVPHFEKMLYDQAQLVQTYLDAYQLTGDETFAAVARDTLDYVLNDLTSAEGGFCSAEDADSIDPQNPRHKQEGAFYVWEKSELEHALTPEESKVFCTYYGVEENGNALTDPHSEFTRKNILFTPLTIEQVADRYSHSADDVRRVLDSAKNKVKQLRAKRARPHRDDKILTSWNGLMLGAFARGANIFGSEQYRNAAKRAAEFLFSHVYDQETKSLFRRYCDGEVRYDGQLDDYAFLISGLLELYQSSFEVRWLQWADDLAGRMITLFWDSAEGAFYDTSGKDPSVLIRTKEAYDGAEPAGNSMAVMDLLRLHHLRLNDAYLRCAEKSLKYFNTILSQSPQIMPHMMCAVDYFLTPAVHVIAAEGKSDSMREWVGEFSKVFAPHATYIVLNEQSREYFDPALPFTKEMRGSRETTTFYYCSQFSCQAPTESAAHVLEGLTKFNVP